MTYEHREKGIRGKLIEENEKTKTVILELEDGKQQPMTTSTLKRWWKKVDEELDENDRQFVAEELATLEKCESKNIPEVLKEENKASDGTPYKQVMQEIIQDEKQAVKKAKSIKKYNLTCEDVTNMIESLRSKLDSQEEITTRVIAKVPGFLAIKKNKKSILEVRIHRTGRITISCKSGKAPSTYSTSKWNNYYLPEHFECDKEDYINVISTIIENS